MHSLRAQSNHSIGEAGVSFDVKNIGRVDVSSGLVNATLKDPDGNIVGSGIANFSASVNQSAMITIPINVQNLKLGNYTLDYVQSDETKTGTHSAVTIQNSLNAAFVFDHASYQMRENSNLTLNVSNPGRFRFANVMVSMTMPDIGFSETKNISALSPGQATALEYTIPIPSTISSGVHSVLAKLSLPSGSFVESSSAIAVPASSLKLGDPVLTAPRTIRLTIENNGGVDTNYITDEMRLVDGKGNQIYSGNISDSILAGQIKTLADIPIPAQCTDGTVYVRVTIQDTKTGKKISKYKAIDVNGVTASLQARTDKNVYQKTESIGAITDITTGVFRLSRKWTFRPFELDNGLLQGREDMPAAA